MRVLITGAAGMIGRKLTERLVADGTIAGKPITSILLHDIVEASVPQSSIDIRTRSSDLASANECRELVADKPDVVFHLAGIAKQRGGNGTAHIDIDPLPITLVVGTGKSGDPRVHTTLYKSLLFDSIQSRSGQGRTGLDDTENQDRSTDQYLFH